MIVDLKQHCGLDAKFDTQNLKLIFSPGINNSEPAVRNLKEMQEVLLDKNITSPQDFYFMYRDVYAVSDKDVLLENKLRYDITVIKPDYLGKELMKTAGHYHPGSYGELYEVVYGKALCLLQRPDPKNHKAIEVVIMVEAKQGQKIVIPPGFGHILINPGPDCLITSNWVSSCFKSEYDLYKKAGGAAYFVDKSSKKFKIVPNPYFVKLADMKCVKPNPDIDKFGLKDNVPIYPLVRDSVKKLDFLNHPMDFAYNDIFIDAKPQEVCVEK